VYGEIVRTVSRFEPVNVIVRGAAQRAEARDVLGNVGADLTNVHFHRIPNDRGWVRDNGPIFVKDTAGELVALDWGFTAWAKYPDWATDDRIAGTVAGIVGVPSVRPTVRGWRAVLEGGSIDVSGDGLMLTTEECLLSTTQHRNPPLDRADYEQLFRDYLGVSQTVWLGNGVAGDDTHGHVDDIGRFVGPRTVVTAVEPNEADANHRPLRDNLDRLRAVPGLTVVELPMPAPLYFEGVRLPASYANFYTFNDPADRRALGILADCFPDRQVVGIHCVDLVWGLGTLHCMTQQQPA
jgi:agmatine deiminase